MLILSRVLLVGAAILFCQSGMRERADREEVRQLMASNGDSRDYFLSKMSTNRDPQMAFALALLAVGMAVRPVSGVRTVSANGQD
jgi:hypothetical protein